MPVSHPIGLLEAPLAHIELWHAVLVLDDDELHAALRRVRRAVADDLGMQSSAPPNAIAVLTSEQIADLVESAVQRAPGQFVATLPPPEQLLKSSAMASRLGISESQLAILCREGLPHRVVGDRARRYDAIEVLAWRAVEEGRVPLTPTPVGPARFRMLGELFKHTPRWVLAGGVLAAVALLSLLRFAPDSRSPTSTKRAQDAPPVLATAPAPTLPAPPGPPEPSAGNVEKPPGRVAAEQELRIAVDLAHELWRAQARYDRGRGAEPDEEAIARQVARRHRVTVEQANLAYGMNLQHPRVVAAMNTAY